MLFAHVLGAAGTLASLALLLAADAGDDERRAALWRARLRGPALAALAVSLFSGGHLAFATGLLQSEGAGLLMLKAGVALLGMAQAALLWLPPPAAPPSRFFGLQLRLALLCALTAAFLGTWLAGGRLPQRG